MRVLEDARKITVAEAFAIASEEFPCLGTHDTRSDGHITRCERGNGATQQIERLVPRETLSTDTKGLGGVGSRRAIWARGALRHFRATRRSRRITGRRNGTGLGIAGHSRRMGIGS